MKRYDDCPYQNSECRKCSLSSYEIDCHGRPADKLSYAMDRIGMNQVQLAAAVGMKQQAISRFQRKERDLGGAQARTVMRIARALYTTVEDLIDEI